MPFGNTLYFGADDGATGIEPWVLPLDSLSCPASPRTGCIAAARGVLVIDDSRQRQERLRMGLSRFETAVAQAQFGDPVLEDTQMAGCIYDAEHALVGSLVVDRDGGTCGAKSGWTTLGTEGYAYADDTATADGIFQLIARGGSAGKGKVVVKAANAGRARSRLPTGLAAALEGSASATVQLIVRDGDCFGAELPTVRESGAAEFRAYLE